MRGRRADYQLPAIGDRFGRWTVVGTFVMADHKTSIPVRCDCGTERLALYANLKRSLSRDCGCGRRALVTARNTLHGRSGSPLYEIWTAMKARCARQPAYRDRGITVCDEWASDFTAFETWALAHGYSPELEIDRIDNDGDYRPENCRWVTHTVNTRNRRNTLMLSAFGERKPLTEWLEDERCHLTYSGLYGRVASGRWSAESAISEPPLR